VAVAKAVLTIHRDFGDRTDRKHARLKYASRSAERIGLARKWSKRAGMKMEPARDYKFTSTGDVYGWNKGLDGMWFLTLFVETGRVKDAKKIACAASQKNWRCLNSASLETKTSIIANVAESEKPANQRAARRARE